MTYIKKVYVSNPECRSLLLAVITLLGVGCSSGPTNNSSGSGNNNSQPETLTVVTSGTGSGSIISTPSGITCPGTCSASFNAGTSVSLKAASDSDSSFSGWSGACSGTGTCTVTLSANTSVGAAFIQNVAQTYTMTVADSGNGTGSVTSSPSGINCPGACSATFNAGTSVILTASAGTNSTFSGWSGGGCNTASACSVVIGANTSLVATFNESMANLTVAAYGAAGSGRVTSLDGSINCPGMCTASYTAGTVVTLSATPNSASALGQWSGGCNGTGACSLTMNNDSFAGAFFDSSSGGSFTLGVFPYGSGTGTVTTADGAINCPGTAQPPTLRERP